MTLHLCTRVPYPERSSRFLKNNSLGTFDLQRPVYMRTFARARARELSSYSALFIRIREHRAARCALHGFFVPFSALQYIYKYIYIYIYIQSKRRPGRYL